MTDRDGEALLRLYLEAVARATPLIPADEAEAVSALASARESGVPPDTLEAGRVALRRLVESYLRLPIEAAGRWPRRAARSSTSSRQATARSSTRSPRATGKTQSPWQRRPPVE